MTDDYAMGWAAAIEAAAQIVCPDPHVTEERRCEEVAVAIRAMSQPSAARFSLRPGVTYLPESDQLIVDGVPFAVGMLADFIAALRPGQRVGPLFLERSAEKIIFKPMDIFDVQLIPMRRERDRMVWS